MRKAQAVHSEPGSLPLTGSPDTQAGRGSSWGEQGGSGGPDGGCELGDLEEGWPEVGHVLG